VQGIGEEDQGVHLGTSRDDVGGDADAHGPAADDDRQTGLAEGVDDGLPCRFQRRLSVRRSLASLHVGELEADDGNVMLG